MMFKRILSAVTVLAMTFSMASVIPSAAEKVPTVQNSAQIANDDVQISGTNSFGRMLASALDEKNEEQNEGSGCNIYSVEVDGNTAAVEYQTTENCTLLVGIYSDDGTEMIAAGTAEVSAEDDLAEVTFDTEEMPEYFYIRAFLTDSTVFRPLSVVYESPMYTKSMQEFLAKTTDDFDEERVLNLDDDSTTNFAVYGEGVILLDETDGTLTEKDGGYVFTGAGERVTALQEGDVFAYGDAENVVIVTVKTVSVDGDTVTVIDDTDAELEDVFEYVKIEADEDSFDTEINDIDAADNDTENSEETKNGTVAQNSKYPTAQKTVNADKKEDKEEWNKFLDVKWGEKYTGRDDKDKALDDGVTKNGSGSLSGSVQLNIKPSAKLYLTWEYRYIEFKVDFSLSVGFKFELEGSIAYPLCEWNCTALGVVNVSFVPSIILEGDIDMSFKYSIKGTWGYKISNKGNTDLSKIEKDPIDFKIEGKLFLGVSFMPKIKVIHEKIASAEADATVGLELECKNNGEPFDKKKYEGMTPEECFKEVLNDDSVNSVHLCDNCLSINAAVKVEIKASVAFLCGWVKLEGKFESEWPIFKGHWSFTYNDFGSGSCPYEKFKVKVHAQNIEDMLDGKGKDLKNASLTIDGKTYSTGNDGYVKLMLSSDRYPVSGSCGKMLTADDAGFVVDDSAVDIIIAMVDPDRLQEVLKKMLNSIFSRSASLTHANSSNIVSVEGKKVVQVALRSSHSACITEDGCLYTWGDNFNGHLGDGTTEDRYTPVKIMDNVAQVSFGGYHSACITKDGTLYTWGDNDSGQLGDGTTEPKNTPVKIMDNVAQVSLGESHSACITKDGSLYTWGHNGSGQLGDGTTEDKHTPEKIMDNVAQVSLGYLHSSCITKDGTLYTWGYNWYGELGDGTTEDKYTPVKIMDNVVQVSLGYSYSACITKDGSLYTWGHNGSGQLGDGTTEDKHAPVKIMDNVAQVSLVYYHSACITKDGALYTWGNSVAGQLGDGTTEDKHTPEKIMDNVAQVSLGYLHSSCITKDGTLYTWGYNYFGQLGDGTTEDKYTPVKIIIPKDDNTASKTAGKTISRMLNASMGDEREPLFSGLTANETYNLYALQDKDAGLTADNVLYIAQQTADEDGCIDFDYVLRNRAEGGTWLAVPMGRTDISSAEAALDDLEYSGEEQFVSPVVTLNGETLTEGIDYYIEGDYSAMLPGTYSLTIRGMGLYAGQLTVGYKVTGEVPDEVTTDDETDVVPTDSEEEQPAETPPEEVPDETEETVLIGDVNGDGIVNVTDISKAAAHVKGIKALSEEEFARADVDKDDAVKVTDISKIAAHIKGIRSLT